MLTLMGKNILTFYAYVCLCESLIPARFYTFMEINHEIISMVILLPSADSRRVVVSYKRKYVHEVLVNRLVKFAKENICAVNWPSYHDHTC